jgi:hypothetical protein
MAKRSRKPRDLNSLAASIVEQATDESAPRREPEQEPEKDAAAVALGRRGGLKGGKARAAKLTPAQRSESARKAVRARWAASDDA